MPNKLALIVNHENITQNWYVGNDRSMLVCNCLFRLGGAGALLSNRCLSVDRPACFLLIDFPGTFLSRKHAQPTVQKSCQSQHCLILKVRAFWDVLKVVLSRVHVSV